MKSIELLPTNQNILATLCKDPFNRNDEIASFLELLITIEGHFVISIDGQWGTGKTFFVKQCELILNVINNNAPSSEAKDKVLHLPFLSKNGLLENLKKQTCIYFDAWINDEYENPILAILQTLSNNRSVFERMTNIDKSKIQALFKELNEEFFSKLTSININKFAETLKDPKDSYACKQDKVHSLISKCIDIFTKNDQRLIIFIDELDRCKPSFAVKLLEQIKHYFLIENVTFVISTNIEELSKTICKFYGINFKGNKYLTRFFDLSLRLSKIDLNTYYSSLASHNQSYIFENYKRDVINFFNMSMRSIGRYVINNELIDYSKFKNDFYVWDSATSGICSNIEWLIISFIIGLRTTNKELEYSLIHGNELKIFTEFVLSSETFWGIFRFDNKQNKMKELCDIDKEKRFGDCKEKIIKVIYDKCFVNQINENEGLNEAGEFWHEIKNQINKSLYL